MQNTTNRTEFLGFAAVLRGQWRWYVCFAAAALALRLFFVLHFFVITPDSLVYGDLAKNWLQHHVYGTSGAEGAFPVDMRLPGYPAYLALCFRIAGVDHYGAACIGQVFVDLATCFVIAALAMRVAGERAARWAFALTAVCPFFANYVSTALPESWTIFLTALALLFAAEGAENLRNPTLAEKARVGHPTEARVGHPAEVRVGRPGRAWAWCGIAIGLATLLRPDSGMLLIAILAWLAWQLVRPLANGGRRRVLQAGVLAGVFTFVPLLPWAVRNAVTLHEFQPLAPVTANEPGEFVPAGFIRWLKTWEIDYASLEDIGFNVSGEAIPFEMVPRRAFDNAEQRSTTEELFRQYNQTLVMTPALDGRFAELARQRIQDSPARYYLELPALRAFDMWLRPRTAMLPVDIHWWSFSDPRDSAVSIALGAWNLALLAAAAWSLRRWRRLQFVPLLLTFVAVRTVLLAAISLPEPRYALECYPVVLALAGAAAARGTEVDKEKSAIRSS